MTSVNQTIQEQICHILKDRCQITVEPKKNNEELHLDSMALMELIVGLENTFNIKLDNEKMEAFYHRCSLNSITLHVEKEIAFVNLKLVR